MNTRTFNIEARRASGERITGSGDVIRVEEDTAKLAHTVGLCKAMQRYLVRARRSTPNTKGAPMSQTHSDTSLPYSVNLWGSKPGTDDDCWTGAERATREEALALYNDPSTGAAFFARTATEPGIWIEIDGPDLHEERRLTADRKRADDDGSRLENAMMAGMAGGCAAYNDAMGYGE